MDKKNNHIKNKEIQVPWGLLKRLEFIEFRLFWEDKINRSDLVSVFSISIPQASADFSRYLEMAPGNMEYNKNEKYYYASKDFKPIFRQPSSEQYLIRFMTLAAGVSNKKRSFLGFVPPADTVDTVPLPFRRVEPYVLKKVIYAIKEKKSLEIEYQSLTRSEKLTRWISPHALGFDGFRWHCRAFCHIDNFFKDFILGRILKVVNERESEIDPKSDTAWENFIIVRIGPNPELEEGHRRILEYEYDMRDGETSLRVRRSMLYYLLNRLGLSVDVEGQSKRRHLVLINKDEVKKALEQKY